MPWDEKTFARLREAMPEALVPRFEITHGMLVNLLSSARDLPGGGYGRLVADPAQRCADTEQQ